MVQKKSQRRQDILEALAEMLESSPGEKITTAKLAARVGVSEAALYRHFPSKAKMFEGLIEFIEDSLFQRVAIILREEHTATDRCGNMLMLLLSFAERNPGMSRIMNGDALAGETERLHQRVLQLYERYETQIKQVLREAELREGLRPVLPLPAAANLLVAAAEGRITQFVRSNFRRSPTEDWSLQYQYLMQNFFREAVTAAPGVGASSTLRESTG